MLSRHSTIIVFLILSLAVIVFGLIFWSQDVKEDAGEVSEMPAKPQTSAKPLPLPDTSGLSEEELLKLWANGERCPQTNIGFGIPSKFEDIITVEGTRFHINILEVNLTADATCEDAERIALFLNGRIVGFGPTTNLYGFQIPTRTVEELDVAIASVEALNDPKIEGVFPAFLPELD